MEAMTPTQIVASSNTKFQETLQAFNDNLRSLRTGRANASMLDGVMVEAYGTLVPLNQAATVTASESQLLQISPFDPSNVAAIATAIRNNAQLGMNPSDDGRIIRVPIPPLTEERRRDIVKQVGQKQEEAMVRMRGIRHDALDTIGKAKKSKEIGEDEAKRYEKQVEEAMTAARNSAEVAARTKEQEIMTL